MATKFKAYRYADSENPLRCYLARVGASSQAKYLTIARHIVGALQPNLNVYEFPWHTLSATDVESLKATAGKQWNRYISVLKQIAEEAWRRELMTDGALLRLRSLKAMRSARLPIGRALSPAEADRLLGVCRKDETHIGARDGALIALMLCAGLRRHETIGLRLEDYTPSAGKINLIGKGNKERVTYLTDKADAVMERWLRLRGSRPGPLIYAVEPITGHVRASSIGLDTVNDRVNARVLQAKLGAIHPHDLRRTFISQLLEDGVDLARVARLAGHSDTKVTLRYDKRRTESDRDAVRGKKDKD